MSHRTSYRTAPLAALLVLLGTLGLAGCGDDEGTMEQTGEQMDEAAEETADAAEEATDEAADAVDDATGN